MGKTTRLTTEQFIERARAVHGDKYDYSITNYINCRTDIDIICPKHGVFTQNPSTHLTGCGCPKCAGKIKLTKEDFINRASKFHKNKGNYIPVDSK